MAIGKTTISLEQDLSRAAALRLKEYHKRQENISLLEKINDAYDDTSDPDDEKVLKASQRAFCKVLDEW